jgi:drug/metabolite transporter (DMT)-like permease
VVSPAAVETQTSGRVARGIGLAALAALLFGVTAPFLKLASQGVGVFAGASLLYLGAAAGAGLWLAASRPRPTSFRGVVAGSGLARLALVAFFGAVLAPALLIAGLARTDGATASLVLVLEAPLTAVLATLFFRERLGPRVVAALLLISVGAIVLSVGGASGRGALGLALVAAAALAWAADNLVSRTLADADPGLVVALKGLLGGAAAAGTAVLTGEPLPSGERIAALLVIGAVGYGVSLNFYLRAQARVGAARTASVFATAPFVGAVVAILVGVAAPTWQLSVASVLMVAGVALHLFETHGHRHAHEALEHEHAHRHDDGHHTHTHVPMPVGAHAHPHRHEALTHEHDHSEDLHHRHVH